ncbi:MAG: hypothetical protein ACYDD5_01080 [Sulfuricurvum sp.]
MKETFTINVDFALPIVVAILAIILAIGHQTLIPKSSIDSLLAENDELFSEVSQANHEISTLTKELLLYQATEEELVNIGASPSQAKDTIKAARLYNLDPKHWEH